MNDLINRAKQFAHDAHDSIQQVRKYTGEPYWAHTDAVAETVAAHGGTEAMIAAAHLHDVKEDVKPLRPDVFTEELFVSLFGEEVNKLVNELTDEYTSANYPNRNRKWRKEMEAARISGISQPAKLIKLADLYNNTASIAEHDPDFAATYLDEKARVLGGLVVSNNILYYKVVKQWSDAMTQLQERRELEERELDNSDRP